MTQHLHLHPSLLSALDEPSSALMILASETIEISFGWLAGYYFIFPWEDNTNRSGNLFYRCFSSLPLSITTPHVQHIQSFHFISFWRCFLPIRSAHTLHKVLFTQYKLAMFLSSTTRLLQLKYQCFGFHGKLNEFYHNKSTINYSLVCVCTI